MLSLGHCTWVPLRSTNKILFGFNKSRRDESLILKAADKESELEIERDKAIQALRNLDDQLQSLSNKQRASPRIRAVDLNQSNSRERENISEISGSFLSYAASALLVLTIFYNILFLTVIKPAIDGPETDQSAEIAALQQLSKRDE